MSENSEHYKKKLRRFIGKYLRLMLGILALIFGLVSMVLPFIPLGYVLVFIAVLFLATYIPPLNRFLNYLKKKDDKDIIEKYDRKMTNMENGISPEGETAHGKKSPSQQD